MKKLFLVPVLLFAIQNILPAQYSVKTGNENSGSEEYQPCNNQYDYAWSATVYKQSDINSHGSITDIFYNSTLQGGFGPGSNTFMLNQRIFMKLVTDNEMTSNAFPDTTQMTLVYAGTVEFLNYQLATIHLDVPFNLDLNHNLMILYINNHGFAQTNHDYFLFYPTEHNQTTNNTVYNNANGGFPGGAGTYTNNMPVVYLKYAPGLDAGISALNQNNIFMLPQQADLTCNFRNYMADTITSTDIEWALNGASQTTYTWAGNNYCGQETAPIILQNNFAFAPGQYQIKANTTNPNNGTDELNDNDTLNINITVSDNNTQAVWSYADNKIPFLSNNAYGWSVSIYNKDSINLSGKINAIAYYVLDNSGMVEPYQKIFMRTTPNMINLSTNYPDTILFTKVFEGDIDYSSIGWHIIELDTVFDYNSAENLMILYENHAGIGTSIATGFKVGWVQTNAIYNYDLNAFPTGDGSIASNSRVPAIRLFFSIPKDAGVTNLANSDIPVFTGNNDFIIDFKNFGTDTLQDVDIKYQIDQNTPASYHWNGTANPQNEITNLNIGSSNLNYGNHDITIWTENPDYLPDYVNRNDTLKISLSACSPLSGTYTIGSAPSDFLSIKAAVDSLNNCGINGAVTFNIKSGIYKAQYVLNEIPGSSATNTITFQSQSGDSTDVVLTTDSTNYLFNLYGADFITFKNLTFKSDSAAKLILLDSKTAHNQFAGNVFTSDTSNCTFISSTTGFNQNNIFISNNLFENGKIGVDLNQKDNIFNGELFIQGNIFDSQADKAIGIYNLNKGEILNNSFTVKNTGIYLNNSDNVNINANKLKLVSANKGINIDNCLLVIISNNFISGKTSGSDNTPIYVKGYWTNKNVAKISYNSINMVDAECASYFTNVDSLYAYNNIFINHTLQIIKKYSTNYIGNYNCFYTNNTIFGSNESPDNITDFSAWQTTLNQDPNSIFALPYFVSNSDLHTRSTLVDNLGIPLSQVTTDIDGEPRDANHPDIGADEFSSICTGPLSGVYTIGATADYQSFNDAIQTLYNCGIDGSVIFNVESGVYNEQLNLEGKFIAYDSTNYPITFKSETGDSTDVVLSYDADSLNNYILKLSGVKNITLKNMTFQAMDTSFGRVVVLSDSVDNINFSNNHIIGVQTSADNNQNACVYSDNLNETDTMAVTFDNNRIVNGSYGIDFDFGSSSQVKTNFMASYNKFYNQSYAGIYLNDVRNLQIIKNNTIKSYNNPNYGIYSLAIDSLNISSNIISLSSSEYNCYGIEDFSSHNIIANNFISLKAIQNANVIGYSSNSFSRFYNNTVFCYGEGGYNTTCVDVSTSNTSEITNNNLVNLFSYLIIHYYYSPPISDYNNLYNAGFNLADWQNTTGMDAHSVSFSPHFVSNTDLHTHAALLNGKGTPLTEVTDDIDGEPRNATTPDIGADEFDNPVFIAGNDTAFCYYDSYFQQQSYVYDVGYGYDSYQWSNGSDSSSIVIDTNTPAGNKYHKVTVTIGSDTYTDSVKIDYDLPVALTQTNYCFPEGGSIKVTAEPNETYIWDSGDTTRSVTFYSSGRIPTLTVTDIHGCKNKATAHFELNSNPADFRFPSDTTICKNQNLNIDANKYTGNDIYNKFHFSWSTGDTTNSISFSGADHDVGSYDISVSILNKTSLLGCTSSDTVKINLDNCTGIGDHVMNGVNIYPNPSTGVFNIKVNEITSRGDLSVINIYGKVVFKEILFPGPGAQEKYIDLSNSPKGIYLIKIKMNKMVQTRKIIIE